MKDKEKFFLSIALKVSENSYCERLKVGAVLVKEENIIAIGYNGTPSGFDNVCEINDITKSEVLHAESNCIAKCARSSQSSEGAELYLTHSPCYECSKMIIQCGINSVYYLNKYRIEGGLELLKKSNIYVEHVFL